MKLSALLVILLSVKTAVAQPAWSPAVRAERENKWMHDSLQLSPGKLHSAYDISLAYYQQLDKYTGNEKMQEKVMRKKDADMKPLLNKEQYKLYYRREKELRHTMKIKYNSRYQPY